MCDQDSTDIINNLNYFCDMKIRLKIKIRIFQNLNFEMENCFLQNSFKYKNMILKQLWSILYMDRIQYTYKNLYLCFWHEIQYRLNRKTKTNKLKTCVCMWTWAYQHYLIFTQDLNTKLNTNRSLLVSKPTRSEHNPPSLTPTEY